MLWSDGQWSVVHLCYEVMVSELLYIYVIKWWSVKCCTSMLWSDDQWSVVHLCYEVMVGEVLCIYVMKVGECISNL